MSYGALSASSSSCSFGHRGLRGPWCVGIVLHAAVERRAVYAQELRGTAQVALRDRERCFDVTALPLLERRVEAERLVALELAFRGIEQAVEVLRHVHARHI